MKKSKKQRGACEICKKPDVRASLDGIYRCKDHLPILDRNEDTFVQLDCGCSARYYDQHKYIEMTACCEEHNCEKTLMELHSSYLLVDASIDTEVKNENCNS